MQAVDDLFQLTMNPLSFFSWEVLWKAKLVYFMAATMWIIPLIATITPATLIVTAVMTQNATDIVVPTLNSSAWDFWNYWYYMPDITDGVSGASLPLQRVLKIVATSGAIIQIPPQFPNSTFELEFFGPSMKCYNLSAETPDPTDKEEIDVLRRVYDRAFGLEQKPSRTWSYGGMDAAYFWGYDVTDRSNDTGYDPETDFLPYDPDLFFIATNLVVTSPTSNWPSIQMNPGTVNWNTMGNITCRLLNTTYSVQFDYGGSEQSTTITRLEETRVNRSLPFEARDDLHLVYMQRAYSGYMEAFQTLLTGYIGQVEDQNTQAEPSLQIELSTSVLASCPEVKPGLQDTMGRYVGPIANSFCRNGSLVRAIEDLAQNLTLSVLSVPFMAANTTVTAQIFTSANRYSYNWRNPALAYGIGIFVTLVGIIIGAYSYITNGYSASMSFSSIVFTTRNRDLDKISEGRCLPALPLGLELGKIKLRYGMLRSEERVGHEHAAFGFSSTIRELKKGTKCV